jgi:hypothetical protein
MDKQKDKNKMQALDLKLLRNIGQTLKKRQSGIR